MRWLPALALVFIVAFACIAAGCTKQTPHINYLPIPTLDSVSNTNAIQTPYNTTNAAGEGAVVKPSNSQGVLQPKSTAILKPTPSMFTNDSVFNLSKTGVPYRTVNIYAFCTAYNLRFYFDAFSAGGADISSILGATMLLAPFKYDELTMADKAFGYVDENGARMEYVSVTYEDAMSWIHFVWGNELDERIETCKSYFGEYGTGYDGEYFYVNLYSDYWLDSEYAVISGNEADVVEGRFDEAYRMVYECMDEYYLSNPLSICTQYELIYRKSDIGLYGIILESFVGLDG